MPNNKSKYKITSLLLNIQESITYLQQGKIPQVHEQFSEMRRKLHDVLGMGGVWLFEPDLSLLDIYVESLQSDYIVQGFHTYKNLEENVKKALEHNSLPFLLICSLTDDVRRNLVPLLAYNQHNVRIFLTSGDIESLRLYNDQVSMRLIPKPFSIQLLHALVEQEVIIWEMTLFDSMNRL